MSDPTPPTPRRVLFVLQSTADGGMETHCVDLAGEMVRRRITVQAIVPAAETFDRLAQRFSAAGVEVQRRDTDARRGRTAQLRSFAGLLRELRRARPDVVHLQTGGATGGLAVVLASRLATGATVVVTEHDVPAELRSRKQAATRWLLDRSAHAIIAVSRRNAALRAMRAGAPRRFASILNGVPAPDEAEDASSPPETVPAFDGAGAVVIGSVVRLADGKGLPTLLRAFAEVRRNARVHLLLVGDGPLRPSLEALAAELGVSSSLTFAGQQRDPDPYLRAMDIFVLAVPAGSMSIALLEAMTRGVPPIITFCGPEEAVVPDVTGLCAPPDDVSALAAAMARLVEDPRLRERLGTQARRYVRRYFSVARVCDDVLDVYGAARAAELPPRLRAAGSPSRPRPDTDD